MNDIDGWFRSMQNIISKRCDICVTTCDIRSMVEHCSIVLQLLFDAVCLFLFEIDSMFSLRVAMRFQTNLFSLKSIYSQNPFTVSYVMHSPLNSKRRNFQQTLSIRQSCHFEPNKSLVKNLFQAFKGEQKSEYFRSGCKVLFKYVVDTLTWFHCTITIAYMRILLAKTWRKWKHIFEIKSNPWGLCPSF